MTSLFACKYIFSVPIQKSEMQVTLKTEYKPAINQEQFDKKHGYRRVKEKNRNFEFL